MSTSTATSSDIRLLDGTNITIRPVHRDDRAGIHDLLDGLSPHARYLRFLRPLPDIADWAVDSLCRQDDHDHVARAAIADGGRVAGIAQLFRHPAAPAAAEVAVTIATPQQRRGLGPVLLHALAIEAEQVGVETFTYVASPANRTAVRLMRRLGARARFDDGVIHGQVPVAVLRRRTEPRAHALGGVGASIA